MLDAVEEQTEFNIERLKKAGKGKTEQQKSWRTGISRMVKFAK